ncbi:MAG: DUF4234 domain-containing protein [Bacteroidales bacterium]|jgi:hypothetical protein|nr:DUF4234 domain-containing protein [Bacteroidales bacterium]MDY0314046.1 DUF4234 domain-containing protein [Bacteroidales bacterium]NLB87072.1 DUF4234 domain-containing protein [Bacteroidales bacterium]
MTKLATNRGFWKTFFLSLITFGIYNLYLMHSMAKETNLVCKEDGKHTKGVIALILLTPITLGIYGLVWRFKIIDRRARFLIKNNQPEVLSSSTYLLTVFLLGNITLGIMHLVVFCKFLYQQNAVNKFYNQANNLE